MDRDPGLQQGIHQSRRGRKVGLIGGQHESSRIAHRRVAQQPLEILRRAATATASASPGGGLVSSGRVATAPGTAAGKGVLRRDDAARGEVQLSRLPRSIEFFPIW